MNYRHLTFAAALALAAVVPVTASAGALRGVVELFTSQGCSSCPPADKLLGELARDPTLVTLSLPVDYWDYLGWKDTLALHGHSKRQRAYAEARGDRQVYTPQAIVNGVVHALGSDAHAIESAIATTDKQDNPLRIPVSLSVDGGTVTVHVSGGETGGQSGEVWLCPVSGRVPVTIERGENHGRILTYYNVVRRWLKLGDWTGKAQSFSVPLASLANEHYTLADVDHLVVLLQGGVAAKPGLMLGAAVATLH